MALSRARKKMLINKYGLTNLFFATYNYDVSFENEAWADTTKSNLRPMPAAERDEEEVN